MRGGALSTFPVEVSAAQGTGGVAWIRKSLTLSCASCLNG